MENRYEFSAESGSGKNEGEDDVTMRKEYIGNLKREMLLHLDYLRKVTNSIKQKSACLWEKTKSEMTDFKGIIVIGTFSYI